MGRGNVSRRVVSRGTTGEGTIGGGGMYGVGRPNIVSIGSGRDCAAVGVSRRIGCVDGCGRGAGAGVEVLRDGGV